MMLEDLEDMENVFSCFFITGLISTGPKLQYWSWHIFLNMKIAHKIELQQIESNHSSEVKYFMKIYKNYAKKSNSFLVSNATLSRDNPLRFWKTKLSNASNNLGKKC